MKYLILLIGLIYQFSEADQVIWVDSACTSSCNGTSATNGYTSIDQARIAARGFPNESVVVNIKRGTYFISSPIVFDSQDGRSSPNQIVYQAYNGEAVVISGGLDVSTGWSFNTVWQKTSVPGTNYIRQLYVNGKRALRARSQATYIPSSTQWVNQVNNASIGLNNITYTSGSGLFLPRLTLLQHDFFSGSDISDVELVWNKEWRNIRHLLAASNSWAPPVGSPIPIFNAIMLQQPSFNHTLSKQPNGSPPMLTPTSKCPFYFENAFELMDQPGEWYFKRNRTLYYKPLAGETLNQVIIPQTECLIKIAGTSSSKVQNISFTGITFAHSNWTGPNTGGNGFTAGGFAAVQAEKIANSLTDLSHLTGSFLLPAAFKVTHGSNISIGKNIFTKLGGAGINLDSGNANIIVRGNYFTDISGAAIAVGHWDQIPIENGTVHLNHDLQISNNLIYDVAKEYFSSCGITIITAQNCTVEHNLITHVPYSGISSGLIWWSGPTNNGSIDIKFNYVNNINRVLYDGGGIYTLGNHGGGPKGASFISRNYLRRDNSVFNPDLPSVWGGYHGGTLYLDQGSGFINGGYNVIDQSPKRLQITTDDICDITIGNNYSTDSNQTNNSQSCSPATRNPVVEFKNYTAGDWSVHPGAWYTTSNAGLQRSYRFLLDYLPTEVKNEVDNKPFSLLPSIYPILLN